METDYLDNSPLKHPVDVDLRPILLMGYDPGEILWAVNPERLIPPSTLKALLVRSLEGENQVSQLDEKYVLVSGWRALESPEQLLDSTEMTQTYQLEPHESPAIPRVAEIVTFPTLIWNEDEDESRIWLEPTQTDTRLKQAQDYFAQALKIWENSFLDQLGFKACYDRALNCYDQALDCFDQALGYDQTLGFRACYDQALGYYERALNCYDRTQDCYAPLTLQLALLRLWRKLYLKLQIFPGASIETHTKSHIGFTYHRILRRALQFDVCIPQTSMLKHPLDVDFRAILLGANPKRLRIPEWRQAYNLCTEGFLNFKNIFAKVRCTCISLLTGITVILSMRTGISKKESDPFGLLHQKPPFEKCRIGLPFQRDGCMPHPLQSSFACCTIHT